MSHPKTWRSNTEMDRANDYLFKTCVGFIIHTCMQSIMNCICFVWVFMLHWIEPPLALPATKIPKIKIPDKPKMY